MSARRRVLRFGVAAIVAVATAACGPSVARSAGVIGVVAPRDRTGSLGMAAGVELALEGWTGEAPRVESMDSRGTVRGAVEAAERLLERGATVVLGPPGAEAGSAVAALADARGVPVVLPECGAGAADGSRWVFALGEGPARPASALARLAGETLGLEAFGIVADLSDPSAQGLADAFRGAVHARGGRVLGERALVPGDPHGGRALTRLLEDHPGVEAVLLAVGGDQVEALVRETDAAQLAGRVLLGGRAWDARDLAPTLRGRVAGAYTATVFSAEDPSGLGSAFATRYRHRTGRPPPSEAALGYDAARLVLGAFEPGLTPDALRRRLAAVRDVPGLTGTMSFGPEGRSPRAVVIEQLHDGSRPRFVSRDGV